MDKETKRQQNLDYINTKINPILERLIIDLLVQKPDKVVLISFKKFLSVIPLK